MSGTGQDPEAWCAALYRALDVNCHGHRDFFQCNYDDPSSSAKPDDRTATYLVNMWEDRVEKHLGINARFDWWGGWDKSDAMHACVESAIHDASCKHMEFANGLRCMPVLHVEPDDGVSLLTLTYPLLISSLWALICGFFGFALFADLSIPTYLERGFLL